MAKRGDNIRRRKDGRWEGRFRIPDDPKVHSVYAHSYEECKKKRIIAIREYKPKEQGCNADSLPVTGSVLARVGKEWLAFIRAHRKTSTYAKYRYLYRKYIEAALSDHAEGVFDCNVELFDRHGITALSVKKCCVTILNEIIRYGVKSGTLTPEKFRVKAEYETKPRKAVEVFTKEEQGTLLNWLFTDMDPAKMGIALDISTGLRLGEVCALKWEDVDFRSRILHVNRTVQRIMVEGGEARTQLVETAPKSDSSVRGVPLSDEVIRLLRRFKHGGEYVIGGNRPVDPRTYEYRFRRYQIKAGIPAKNFHVLRHTFATNCINIGMDAKSVSEILGHHDVRITLNRYVHPSMESKRASMNLLSAEYGQMRGQDESAA